MAEPAEMTVDDFDRFLLAHGPHRARWPDADAAAAEALIARSPEARAMLAEAAALETSIARMAEAPLPAGALATRVGAHIRQAEGARAAPLRLIATIAGLAGATSIAAGLYVGSLIDPGLLLPYDAGLGAEIVVMEAIR